MGRAFVAQQSKGDLLAVAPSWTILKEQAASMFACSFIANLGVSAMLFRETAENQPMQGEQHMRHKVGNGLSGKLAALVHSRCQAQGSFHFLFHYCYNKP